MPPPIRARFDDLITGSAFELRQPTGQLVAGHHREVRAILEAADRAARSGKWVAGYVTYEASPAFDAALAVRAARPDRPVAWFGVFAERAEVAPIDLRAGEGKGRWRLDWTAARHARAVARIKDFLAAGETYQVNLTVRARADIGDPFTLYRAMAAAQGGAYNAYLETGTQAIVCASPELFFQQADGCVVTRPMKGTRPRGRWSGEDTTQAQALLASGKDRAEHVMIVDLLRNDLGRIARPGSVTVRDLASLERYHTVWQLTSTIAAQLAPDATPVDVFGALFPSGSVTGAPKARTMQIIADLETDPRGVYCGALGYLAPGSPPPARFAVAIRTATIDLTTGCAEYGTGGAITWPSDARSEWAELLAKCAILVSDPRPSGLFETLRFDPGSGPINLNRHLDRLAASADYFGLRFDRDRADKEVRIACAASGQPRRVRVELSGSGALTVSLRDLPDAPTRPVRLGLAGGRVDSRDVRLFHKSVDRRTYDQIRAARPDVDDVVLHNERDEVTETTIANLAVRLDGRWWTPPLDCGLLPGVERQRLIDTRLLGERAITVAELQQAEGLAVINSLRGWRSARLAD
jgi:para-aminobenzoate synthetase / 4-amino-4-deoxychorismate lyase